ncbi:MAG: hypothetical protein MZV64_20965 [Ignavibacteriales bacterium]|nr:hypothetical protein [Ignavibacteriales bacterium]
MFAVKLRSEEKSGFEVKWLDKKKYGNPNKRIKYIRPFRGICDEKKNSHREKCQKRSLSLAS